MSLDQLTKTHKKAIADAIDSLEPCRKCHGKPWITYEPGCVRSVCAMSDKACRMVHSAPDMELGELVGKINDQALASEGLPAAPCSLPNNNETSKTDK